MTHFKLHAAGGYLHFDPAECRASGEVLSAQYKSAEPFPHIVIDDFIAPNVLRDIAKTYPTTEGKTHFDRAQERLKYQFHPDESGNALTRNLLAELNGSAFMGFLAALTGIEGLISDPYYSGGGLHETRTGGHLSIHADFNIHEVMKVRRRINLLVYLNEDWPANFGGNLELWDKAMRRAAVNVAPIIGRAVIFNTDLDSFHGQPEPLTCPPERSRKSIATYYYSAFESSSSTPNRNTNFRPRPGQKEKTDWQVRYQHAVNDWVPPRLQNLVQRLNPWKRA
jgi:Rps23 Pro-64 3,4-dihydroxylase Tpa1-like proline 4-hydroxylase